MSSLNLNKFLFNAAGVLIGVVVVGYNVFDHFASEKPAAACGARYMKTTQLSLNSASGKMLTPIELQSRAGSGEWGVLENARVVATPGAPTPLALEVKLAKLGHDDEPHGGDFTGVRMSWLPTSLDGSDAACLSYSVWMPETFDFGSMGTLPGLYGGHRPTFTTRTPQEAEAGFAARIVWGADGEGAVGGAFPGGPEGIGGTVGGGFVLPRGRWVNLEQEVVLNRAGEADGLYRLWLDGKLVSQTQDIMWRRRSDVKITGMISDINSHGAKTTGTLRVSQPVVSWR